MQKFKSIFFFNIFMLSYVLLNQYTNGPIIKIYPFEKSITNKQHICFLFVSNVNSSYLYGICHFCCITYCKFIFFVFLLQFLFFITLYHLVLFDIILQKKILKKYFLRKFYIFFLKITNNIFNEPHVKLLKTLNQPYKNVK